MFIYNSRMIFHAYVLFKNSSGVGEFEKLEANFSSRWKKTDEKYRSSAV